MTDNGGERVSTMFTDNFSGWKELQFPWQVFSHDGGYQPGGAPNDGPTLTAVEAFAFAPTSPSSGTYFMDQIKLFKNTNSVVADFQTGGVGIVVEYGDGAAVLAKTVVLTNTLVDPGRRQQHRDAGRLRVGWLGRGHRQGHHSLPGLE